MAEYLRLPRGSLNHRAPFRGPLSKLVDHIVPPPFTFRRTTNKLDSFPLRGSLVRCPEFHGNVDSRSNLPAWEAQLPKQKFCLMRKPGCVVQNQGWPSSLCRVVGFPCSRSLVGGREITHKHFDPPEDHGAVPTGRGQVRAPQGGRSEPFLGLLLRPSGHWRNAEVKSACEEIPVSSWSCGRPSLQGLEPIPFNPKKWRQPFLIAEPTEASLR